MTVAAKTKPGLATTLINGLLSVKPLANIAKHQARKMMMKRAEKFGVYWQKEVQELQNQDLEGQRAQVQNPQLKYPDYYFTYFHAYEEGNLGWHPATEVEVAALAVHSGIWPNAGAQGDAKLRESYHKILQAQLPIIPNEIVDLGCSVGMSTFALQELYPAAKITGVDLSPYFLAIANLRSQQRQININWVHAAGEDTGLPSGCCDLVSIFLVFHELPQKAAIDILREARRLLRPNGYLGIMDMNPKSEIYAKMPPYILTLLKSTEPYLDEYFTLDIEQAFVEAGFEVPSITPNSPRHRTIVAKVKS